MLTFIYIIISLLRWHIIYNLYYENFLCWYFNPFLCKLTKINKIISIQAESDSHSSEFCEHPLSFYLERLRVFRNFVSFSATSRRVVLSQEFPVSRVTWQAGDITIPFIFPLMPTVTHTFPQSRYFPENRDRRFAKHFPRARTRTCNTNI